MVSTTEPVMQLDLKTLGDMKTLARFVDVYCRAHHADAVQSPVRLKGFDLDAIAGKPLALCPQCSKLLSHAFVKRSVCPMDPKPACKHCPNHCYHPTYRRQIREVMKDSGRRLVLHGRLDYLLHLLM